MNLLSVDSVSKAFTEKVLFENLTLGISQGDKAAIVGINGCGKSTLLKMIGGEIAPDSGNVSIRKGTSIGYLSQQPNLSEDLTVWQAMFETENPVLLAIQRYEKALLHDQADEVAEAAAQMEQLGAWETESKIHQTLGKLGIQDTEKLIRHLSGGQRKRVALAKLLLSKADLIVLDEPTNHLDLETIEWLENLLNTENQSLLLVTHDRYFLDRVVNVIFELENGILYRYNGNYAYYLEKKQERMETKQAEVEKARNLMRREYEWIKKQPKARGTKAKYRVDAFEEIKEKANQKVGESQLAINVGMVRGGTKIIELQNISKNFGNQVLLHKFDYVFKRQDRIGVVGKNGVGKSTFLNLLTGELAPDKGNISRGDNTLIGYYTQQENSLPLDKKVIDVVKDVAEFITTGTGETISASVLLTHFEFPPATQYQPVAKLSGGEKRRLQLLQVLIKNPNFLILDEPTNDFDIKTLNILEDYLLGFKGVLVLVSHDRYFMDRLVDHIFVFEGNGVVNDFSGNYTDYREAKAEKEAAQKELEAKESKKIVAPPLPSPTKNTDKSKTKLSFKEKFEYENLEQEIAKLEAEKQVITEKISLGSISNYLEIQEQSKRIEQLTALIDEKSMRWLELAELVG